jgi:XTP/dITP diphosphohydrolase
MNVLIATSNKGKLRDFAGAALVYGIKVDGIQNFSSLPEAVEDGLTFEENARKKSEHYSRFAPGELVLADDSGLAVDALGGAPGVYSARYAAADSGGHGYDVANNARLLRELDAVSEAERTGRFVCVTVARLLVFEAKPRGRFCARLAAASALAMTRSSTLQLWARALPS